LRKGLGAIELSKHDAIAFEGDISGARANAESGESAAPQRHAASIYERTDTSAVHRLTGVDDDRRRLVPWKTCGLAG
jgi:hypothetical protein